MAVNNDTSIPNGRSKRDLNNMKEAKVKEVNKQELKSLIGNFNPFEVIGMVVSFKDNIKTLDEEITEASSKGRKVYSVEEMNDKEKFSVISKRVCFVAREDEERFKAARTKAENSRKKKLKELEEAEARKLEEMNDKENENNNIK